MTAQLSIFPSTNALVGLTVKLETDGLAPCHGNLVTLGSSSGPHHHSMTCADCGRHRGWLPARATEFIRTTLERFGAPADPIVLRTSNFNQGDETMTKQNFDNNNTGALFKDDRKQKDGDRDYSGTVNAAGLNYWVSAWIKTSAKGTKYMALSLKLKDGEAATKAELNDEVPF